MSVPATVIAACFVITAAIKSRWLGRRRMSQFS